MDAFKNFFLANLPQRCSVATKIIAARLHPACEDIKTLV